MSQGWPQSLRHEQCVASTIVRFHADAVPLPRALYPWKSNDIGACPNNDFMRQCPIYSRGALPNLLNAIGLCFSFVVR
jgi:hypothetical protein